MKTILMTAFHVCNYYHLYLVIFLNCSRAAGMTLNVITHFDDFY